VESVWSNRKWPLLKKTITIWCCCDWWHPWHRKLTVRHEVMSSVFDFEDQMGCLAIFVALRHIKEQCSGKREALNQQHVLNNLIGSLRTTRPFGTDLLDICQSVFWHFCFDIWFISVVETNVYCRKPVYRTKRPCVMLYWDVEDLTTTDLNFGLTMWSLKLNQRHQSGWKD
jgi:hypothetical protein